MLDRLTAREKKLIKIFLIIILIVSLYQFGYKFLWSNYKDIKNKIDFEKQSLESLQKIVDSTDAIKNELFKVQLELEKARDGKEVDIRSGVPWLQVGKLLRENALELTSFKPQPIEDKNFYLILPLQINVEGKHTEILHFINSLEQLSNVCHVENLIIKSGFEDSDNMQAAINVIVYGSKSGKDSFNIEKWTKDWEEIFKPKEQEKLPLELTSLQTINNDSDEIFYKRGNYSFPVKIGGK